MIISKLEEVVEGGTYYIVNEVNISKFTVTKLAQFLDTEGYYYRYEFKQEPMTSINDPETTTFCSICGTGLWAWELEKLIEQGNLVTKLSYACKKLSDNAMIRLKKIDEKREQEEYEWEWNLQKSVELMKKGL
jgi:hypothetical protein